jgi:hypothetical protein
MHRYAVAQTVVIDVDTVVFFASVAVVVLVWLSL